MSLYTVFTPSLSSDIPYSRKFGENFNFTLNYPYPLFLPDSFTLAEDLLGLDLSHQPQSEQLTSIQELIRNERLVVNKSKWVDSKLVEFSDHGNNRETDRNGGSRSQPSPPEGSKRNNSVQLQLLQLGLDANKVSTFTSSRKELSLDARSILGRLPDLSFMLPTDTLVQSAKYSI